MIRHARRKCLGVILGAIAAMAINQPVHAQDKLVLKLAHVQPESHPFHKGSVKFAETLKQLSGGSMDVQVFANGVMGNERDLLEALQIGSMDFVTVTSALTGKFNPAYQMFSLPFLFDSYEDAAKVMDRPKLQQALAKPLVAKGIRPIAYWIGGARSYYGTTGVDGVADLKGKKVRTMEDPYYVQTWKSLGAIPTPLPFSEVYMGLQTKLVDGAEGAINTYISKKFYEAAPNVAMIDYVYSVQLLHMAESTWKKLDARQRQWVMQAAQTSADFERQLIIDEDKGLAETLAKLNVKVTHPDIKKMRAQVQPVYQKYRKDFGEDAYELVRQIAKE